MPARDSQDLELAVKLPSSSKARDSQDVELAVKQPTSKARLSSDVVLYLIKNPLPATALLYGAFTDYQRNNLRRGLLACYQPASAIVTGFSARRRPVAFVVS